MNNSLEWDVTFLKIAYQIAEHSTCTKAQVGAVLTVDRRIISTGFNGVPSGVTPHCCDKFKPEDFFGYSDTPKNRLVEHGFWQIENEVHAELNAILFAARYGISTKGATIYTTMSPCPSCANAIINAGIIRVVFNEKYRITYGLEVLDKVGIQWQCVDGVIYPGEE